MVHGEIESACLLPSVLGFFIVISFFSALCFFPLGVFPTMIFFCPFHFTFPSLLPHGVSLGHMARGSGVGGRSAAGANAGGSQLLLRESGLGRVQNRAGQRAWYRNQLLHEQIKQASKQAKRRGGRGRKWKKSKKKMAG
jgi:hypothetical protein